MIIIGWNYAKNVGSIGSYVSLTWLSRFWMYFPIPLAGVAMFFFEIERIFIDVQQLCLGKEDKE